MSSAAAVSDKRAGPPGLLAQLRHFAGRTVLLIRTYAFFQSLFIRVVPSPYGLHDFHGDLQRSINLPVNGFWSAALPDFQNLPSAGREDDGDDLVRPELLADSPPGSVKALL